jgi:hypothetical protein
MPASKKKVVVSGSFGELRDLPMRSPADAERERVESFAAAWRQKEERERAESRGEPWEPEWRKRQKRTAADANHALMAAARAAAARDRTVGMARAAAVAASLAAAGDSD